MIELGLFEIAKTSFVMIQDLPLDLFKPFWVDPCSFLSLPCMIMGNHKGLPLQMQKQFARSENHRVRNHRNLVS